MIRPNDSTIQAARVPRGIASVETKLSEPPRLRHRDFTLILSVVVVLSGSGGIIAEMFHTGQVFNQAYASYLNAASTASGRGIGLLEKATSESEVNVAAAAAEAEERLRAARADNYTQAADALVTVPPRDALMQSLRFRNDAVRIQLIDVVRKLFVEAQTEARKWFKDPNYAIKVGFNAIGEDGLPDALALYPVPWTDDQSRRILLFLCVHFPGINDGQCTQSDDPRVRVPEARKLEQLGLSETVMGSSAHIRSIGDYQLALSELEQVVFFNLLDLERFKGSHRALTGSEVGSVNRELTRLRLGLEQVRKRLEAAAELRHVLQIGEYDGEKRAVMLAELVESSLRNDLRPYNGPNPVSRWIAEVMPSFTRSARRERQVELQRRGSHLYRTTRPFLANLWEFQMSGWVGLDGFFTNEAKSGEGFRVPGLFQGPERSEDLRLPKVPFWIAVAIPAICVAMITCLFWRARASFRVLRGSLLMCAPIAILVLVFPVQHAFTVNASTLTQGESITSDVIGQQIVPQYDGRAGAIQRRLGAIAARHRSRGDADAKVLVSIGEARQTVLKNQQVLNSTHYLTLPDIAFTMNNWFGSLMRVPEDKETPLFVFTLHRAIGTLDHEWSPDRRPWHLEPGRPHPWWQPVVPPIERRATEGQDKLRMWMKDLQPRRESFTTVPRNTFGWDDAR